MSKNSVFPLSHLAIISVKGKDAVKFLQGQCTQDIKAVERGEDCAGAFCTPKGRVVTNVWLHAHRTETQQIDMICAQSAAPLLHKHLAKYIPFFRGTEMTLRDDLAIFGFIGESTGLPSGYQTVHLAEPLCLAYGPGPASKQPSESEWLQAEIKHQQLWLNDEQSEQWIPQNVNLDTLNAISFDKGCYTGQEVVARLHYKGDSKKRMFSLMAKGEHKITELYQKGSTVGSVIQHAYLAGNTYALAVINKNSAEQNFFIDENEQVAAELLH